MRSASAAAHCAGEVLSLKFPRVVPAGPAISEVIDSSPSVDTKLDSPLSANVRNSFGSFKHICDAQRISYTGGWITIPSEKAIADAKARLCVILVKVGSDRNRVRNATIFSFSMFSLKGT